MDIALIPGVMRNRLHWETAAALMERWFSLPANANADTGPMDRHTVRMAWAMRFARAREACNGIEAGRVWLQHATQQRIVGWLRSQNKLTSQSTSFGLRDFNTATPRQLTEDCIYTRGVGSLIDELDDMFGALGSFEFRVVVSGTVSPLPARAPGPPSMTLPALQRSSTGTLSGRYEIRVEQVGIFLWDSFDFNRDQELGFWSLDGVARNPLSPGYERVTNADFRQWRTAHGRGGDFYVCSDERIIRRSPPDTFTV